MARNEHTVILPTIKRKFETYRAILYVICIVSKQKITVGRQQEVHNNYEESQTSLFLALIIIFTATDLQFSLPPSH